MHVILIAHNCSLKWGGECALPYHWFTGLRSYGIRVSLVTHVRNRVHLSRYIADEQNIYYIDNEQYARYVWQLGRRLVDPSQSQLSWATTGSALRLAFETQARSLIRRNLIGRDTIVHRVTPIAPRWPFLFGRLGVPTVAGPLSALPALPGGFGTFAKSQGLRLYDRLKVIGSVAARMLTPPDMILCANQYTVACLPRRLREGCRIMPENGIVPGVFKASADVHDPPTVVMVSRLDARKFCDLGIRAFREVRSRARARLVIIGDGPERAKLENLVSEMSLGSSVEFAGWLGQQEVAAHLRKADIFCHPSVLDSSPTCVLEAMASAKPIVCAGLGGHAEWVTPELGISVEVRNPEALVSGLANAMVTLIRSPERRIAMGRAASAKVASCFEWPARIKSMVAIYSSLLNARAGSARGELRCASSL